MNLEVTGNPNYVATVIKVPPLEKLEGLDNLRAIRALGMTALVSKDVEPGTLGILLTTEVQLSDEVAHNNNLYRHQEMNADPEVVTGYLEDNRRVKAIRLRGHVSDSLFLDLEDFVHNMDIEDHFREGDTFDTIDGVEILRKYVVPGKGSQSPNNQAKAAPVVANFPEHIDSMNFWRFEHMIPENAPVVVTQKLHGTSVRYGNVELIGKRGFFTRLFEKITGRTLREETGFVVGSRHVIKSVNFMARNGVKSYYSSDIWSYFAGTKGLQYAIPEGYIVYGELVGFDPGTGGAIQKNYTYDLAPGQVELYIYRVAVTVGNDLVDLSWPQVKQFAQRRGLRTVPELFTTTLSQFMVDLVVDGRYYDVWIEQEGEGFVDRPVPLSGKKTVDEGVCVRYDGPDGVTILKAKSPIFLAHESAELDTEEVDMESAQ